MTDRRTLHEPDSMAVRPVVIVLMLTALGVPLSALALWLALQALSPPPTAGVGPAPPEIPPEQPTLQTDPRGEYARYREPLKQRLNSLGWVDRKAGVAHIPIREAMAQLLAQGLSEEGARPQANPPSKGNGSAP